MKVGGSVVFAVVTLVAASGASEPKKNAAEGVNAVRTAEEAVHKAVRVSGFEELDSFDGSTLTGDIVEVVSLCDSMSDFWADSVATRRAWRVSLPTVTLDIKRVKQVSHSGGRTEYSKGFDIYLDSLTGKILKIETRADKEDSAQILLPTPKDAEKQIRELGEGYCGLPDVDPVISFLHALDKCKFYYLIAEKIVAVYVLHSYSTLEGGPRPAWVITLSGGLPYYSPHAGIPEYMLANRRTIVDATTGARIYSTNLPYAVPEDSGR